MATEDDFSGQRLESSSSTETESDVPSQPAGIADPNNTSSCQPETIQFVNSLTLWLEIISHNFIFF